MPNIEVKLRRGNTSDHASFAGAEGEVTVDTDKDTLIVHTGGAAGSGVELRRKDDTIAGSEIDNDAIDTAQIAANAVTSTEIADDAITPAQISSTNTLLNVNDTHQTIGLGILANATGSFPKVKMDGGVQVGDQTPSLTSINSELSVTGNGNLNLLTVENTSSTSTDQSVVVVKGPVPTLQLNDTVAPTDEGVINLNMTDGELRFTLISDDTLTTTDLVKIGADGTLNVLGTEASAYVDSNLTNLSGTGLGGRMRIIQGSNVASVQYQENGEKATLNISDGSLSANAGIAVACSSASQASVQPLGSMYDSGTFNSNVDLGSSANTWDNGYINSGAWTGSDRNLKQDIEDLSETELRVATALKGLMKKFRLKDAVAKKGDDARIHIGVIAQDVKAAFEAEGLDAYRYAIIGEDTWWSKQDEDGEWIIKNDNPNDATYTEYTKMSVRYEQLLAFIIAAM